MKPIRGQRNRNIVHDPWARDSNQMDQADIAHILSDSGAIESYQTQRQFSCGCGCLLPAKGFCAVCSETVCIDCFGHCRCGKPLCPRHSLFVTGPTGQSIRLCQACHESIKRKHFARTFWRTLLSPFFRFKD